MSGTEHVLSKFLLKCEFAKHTLYTRLQAQAVNFHVMIKQAPTNCMNKGKNTQKIQVIAGCGMASCARESGRGLSQQTGNI